MRDDFTQATKDLLANRVGCKCSNPNCRKPTRGASKDKDKIINIGVASHICAASAGGPRYDENMTSEERKGIDNGIWLCQSCSKLIDSDVKIYTVEFLRSWKSKSEELSSKELETSGNLVTEDKELIQFYASCFDRPAFLDEISYEGCMEDFDKAIEDTIIALSTGTLRTRTGEIIKKSKGKTSVVNTDWRMKLDNIYNLLRILQKRLKKAEKDGAYTKYGDEDIIYHFSDRELKEWFDSTREEISNVFSTICREAGINELKFPIYRKY